MSFPISGCRPEELPALLELVDRIFRSRRPGQMGREYPLLFSEANLEQLRIIRADGKPVAHVGICLRDATILGCRIRVAGIGSVGTDPDYRGRGMASALMEDARRHSILHGASLMLISGTRGLYHRLGYVQVGRFLSVIAPAGAGGGVLPRRFGPADLATVIALHQREPIRYLRPRDDWCAMLACENLMNQPADLWLVEEQGTTVAYVATQRPSESAVDRPIRAYEFAGDRRAVVEALPALARHYGAAEIELVCQPEEGAIVAEARRRLWRTGWRPFPGTLGVIDAPTFLAAIRPYLEEQLGRDLAGLEIEPLPEGAIFRRAGAEYRLETRGALTALLFGGETDEARAIAPAPEPVAEALNRAFPMPLLWYGYNYV